MLPGCGQGAQSRGVGGIPSRLGIELFPKAAHIFRFVVHNWEHPAQEEE